MTAAVKVETEILYIEDLGEALDERGPGWRRIGVLLQLACFQGSEQVAAYEGPAVFYTPS